MCSSDLDANGPMLEVLLDAAGVDIVQRAVLPDDRTEIDARLREAAEADLIVTSGGVSVGEADLVRAGVEALGRIDHWRIFLKPGKPLAIGEVLGTPFLGLPGTPSAAMISFELYARPVIRRLGGQQPYSLLTVDGRLSSEVKKNAKKTRWLTVRRGSQDEDPWRFDVCRTAGGGLRDMVEIDGLAEIGPGAGVVGNSDQVPIHLLDKAFSGGNG